MAAHPGNADNRPLPRRAASVRDYAAKERTDRRPASCGWSQTPPTLSSELLSACWPGWVADGLAAKSMGRRPALPGSPGFEQTTRCHKPAIRATGQTGASSCFSLQAQLLISEINSLRYLSH